MKSYLPAICLALAIMGIALLAMLDVIPQQAAQLAPVALLALFPGVWLKSRGCASAR